MFEKLAISTPSFWLVYFTQLKAAHVHWQSFKQICDWARLIEHDAIPILTETADYAVTPQEAQQFIIAVVHLNKHHANEMNFNSPLMQSLTIMATLLTDEWNAYQEYLKTISVWN